MPSGFSPNCQDTCQYPHAYNQVQAILWLRGSVRTGMQCAIGLHLHLASGRRVTTRLVPFLNVIQGDCCAMLSLEMSATTPRGPRVQKLTRDNALLQPSLTPRVTQVTVLSPSGSSVPSGSHRLYDFPLVPLSLGLFWPFPLVLFCGVWFQVRFVRQVANRPNRNMHRTAKKSKSGVHEL